MRLALDDRTSSLGTVVGRVASSRRTARAPAVLDRPALMPTIDPVLDELSAGTASATAAQFSVELLQQPRTHLADRLITERRIEAHPGPCPRRR